MPQEPAIRNWRSSPPQGGWGINYTPPESPGTQFPASGNSYTEVLTKIHKWRKNNGWPNDSEGVFSFANQVWCQKDPGRCTEQAPPQEIAGAGRRTLTPADYGRVCWGFLATHGVYFNQTLWLMTISQIRALLDPNNPSNHGSGCPNCSAHFRTFTDAHPPEKVTNSDEAGVWCWTAHDAANLYSGKAHRPSYRQAAALHGWQPLTDEEFARIKSNL